MKLLIDFGPLAAFFLVYKLSGELLTATVALIAATLLALALGYARERRIARAPLISAVLVVALGGLTLWLQDDTFIKMKPTLVNLLFAGILLVGLATGRALLKPLLEMAIRLDEAGWRKLTFRWGLFFLAMAAANELVWRTQGETFWVNYKVFAQPVLTVLFMLAQLPLLQRHKQEGEGA